MEEHGERLETRFREKAPAFSRTEAASAATRCLYCFDAPCIRACPTAIDVPTFIRKISTGNVRGAARTILQANLLGASCARVCPVEVLCEGDCVYVPAGRSPVAIGRLQRYAMDHGASPELLEKAPATGRRVALVGAGPASLACAGTLALLGHSATVFEKSERAGGLNTTGVAPYKLQRTDALAEVDFLQSLGFEIRPGVTIGEQVTAGELLSGYEAVFLGPGLGPDSRLGVPGEDGAGVIGAVDWIERMKTVPGFSIDGVRRAIVVGGGNTAVDVARELCGLGVESVTMVYRRDESAMKAYEHELAPARAEGTRLVDRTAVAEILREGERVHAVRLVETREGRPTDREREVAPADLVVIAIGQAKLARLAAMFPGVECDARGRIVVDPQTGATGNPRVFAGGDAVNGGKEVVNAAHDGQLAARSIDALLTTGHVPASPPPRASSAPPLSPGASHG